MEDLRIRNERLRERFEKFLEDNYNPQLKALAKVIGVGYSDLCSWKVGRIDYARKNLDKLESFLNNKG